jgi:bla regulator protein blaR1
VQKLNPTKRVLLGALAGTVLIAPAALGLSHATGVRAQSDAQRTSGSTGTDAATGSRPTFEAVSVKPDPSGSGYWRNTADGFSASAHVNTLIMGAYSLTDEQLISLPGWASTDSFAVEAKMDADTAAALDRLPPLQHSKQVQLMMQSMLADRFALRAHYSTRILPVYELRIAKSGYKMKKSPVDAGGNAMFSNGKIEAQSTSMTMLALNLSGMMGQVVVDKTGLQGSYDFALEWAPEGADPSDPRPSIFTAFEEQLGLKLVAAKGPVDVLVVDGIERPSPN